MSANEEVRPDPRCPFCGVRDAEVISLFGTQAILMQYRCRSCGSFFEANKYPADTPTDGSVDKSGSRHGLDAVFVDKDAGGGV